MTSHLQPGAPPVDLTGRRSTQQADDPETRSRPGSTGRGRADDAGPGDGSGAVRQGRVAGLLYLVMAVFGSFAQIVRVRTYAPGDAATTATNLREHASLVRMSFAADLVQNLVWLVLAVVLYRLLQHAGRNLARAMVAFVILSAGIASINLVHQLGAVLVATTPVYATTFGPMGSDGAALLLMDLHHHGYLIAQLSWTWLFALGLLAYRSEMMPRPLAVALMVATPCYMIDALVQLLAPSLARTSASIFVGPEVLCEVALLVYLLSRGVRTPPPSALVAAA